jgi:hypothetical protein
MRAVQAYCERKGWHLAAEFVEQGATATDDNRPEFQKMIERPAMTIIPMMSSWSMRSAASSAMVSRCLLVHTKGHRIELLVRRLLLIEVLLGGTEAQTPRPSFLAQR